MTNWQSHVKVEDIPRNANILFRQADNVLDDKAWGVMLIEIRRGKVTDCRMVKHGCYCLEQEMLRFIEHGRKAISKVTNCDSGANQHPFQYYEILVGLEAVKEWEKDNSEEMMLAFNKYDALHTTIKEVYMAAREAGSTDNRYIMIEFIKMAVIHGIDNVSGIPDEIKNAWKALYK